MSVTVKDFLRHNPNAMLDLMTPKGLIQLTPDRGQWLLTKNGQCTDKGHRHPGSGGRFRSAWADRLQDRSVQKP